MSTSQPPLPRKPYSNRKANKKGEPSLYSILLDVCRCFDTDIEKVLSKSREEKYVKIRRIYSYVCNVTTSKSLKDIGWVLGGRDHTTCVNHVNQCVNWFKNGDTRFNEDWAIYVSKSSIWNRLFRKIKSS